MIKRYELGEYRHRRGCLGILGFVARRHDGGEDVGGGDGRTGDYAVSVFCYSVR